MINGEGGSRARFVCLANDKDPSEINIGAELDLVVSD